MEKKKTLTTHVHQVDRQLPNEAIKAWLRMQSIITDIDYM